MGHFQATAKLSWGDEAVKRHEAVQVMPDPKPSVRDAGSVVDAGRRRFRVRTVTEHRSLLSLSLQLTSDQGQGQHSVFSNSAPGTREAALASYVLATGIHPALDLLLVPKRLVATLKA